MDTKVICHDEIQLHAHNVDTILGLVVYKVGRAFFVASNRKECESFILASNNLCTSTINLKHEMIFFCESLM